jgi:hypothetical protein
MVNGPAMHQNPYHPTRVPLDPSAAPRASAGFPFLLVSRWVLVLVLVGWGVMGMIGVIGSWSVLADRAIVYPDSNPYLRLAVESCALLAGVLLFFRSKFVFVPLLGHIAYVLWLTFGSGPVPEIPGLVYVAWTVQSGLLAYFLLLSINRHLR